MIKPKTRAQIALEYGFSSRTLTRRLAAAGIRIPHRNLLLPSEQKFIYETLGWPAAVEREGYEEIKSKVIGE